VIAIVDFLLIQCVGLLFGQWVAGHREINHRAICPNHLAFACYCSALGYHRRATLVARFSRLMMLVRFSRGTVYISGDGMYTSAPMTKARCACTAPDPLMVLIARPLVAAAALDAEPVPVTTSGVLPVPEAEASFAASVPAPVMVLIAVPAVVAA
jgi:hypothetical protein